MFVDDSYHPPDYEEHHQHLHDVYMPRLPSQQEPLSASQTSVTSNGSFNRQDSLAICSKLQDADRGRNMDMMDFMERDMDIDEYIKCLKDLEVQPEHIDLDDNELQKSHVLYENDAQPDYDPFAHIAHNEELVPQQSVINSVSTVSSRSPSVCPTPALNAEQVMGIKSEPHNDYEFEYDDASSVSQPSTSKRRGRDVTTELKKFKPSTRARDYNLKTEEEKCNPNYKLKRARNNDAVRKSRTKQKEAQQKREAELTGLRDEVSRLSAALEMAEQQIEEQKRTIARLCARR